MSAKLRGQIGIFPSPSDRDHVISKLPGKLNSQMAQAANAVNRY